MLSGRCVALQTRNQFKLNFVHNIQCCPSSSREVFFLGMEVRCRAKNWVSGPRGIQILSWLCRFVGKILISHGFDTQDGIENHHNKYFWELPRGLNEFSCERGMSETADLPVGQIPPSSRSHHFQRPCSTYTGKSQRSLAQDISNVDNCPSHQEKQNLGQDLSCTPTARVS